MKINDQNPLLFVELANQAILIPKKNVDKFFFFFLSDFEAYRSHLLLPRIFHFIGFHLHFSSPVKMNFESLFLKQPA